MVMPETDSGGPIATEQLRYGLRMTVIGTRCDPRRRSDAGLELAGPRYFGYDVDYAPVELAQA
jgi:DUF917 family protein